MYYSRLSDLGIKLTRHSGNEKTKCPQCSDGRKNKADKPLSVSITTGEFHCHHCGWKGNVRTIHRKDDRKKYDKPDLNLLKTRELNENVIRYIESRGISKETCEKFLIFAKETWMPQTQKKERCICFPYIRDGELVNVKYRDANKNFSLTKDAELILYNLQSIGDRKHVIITEGEFDCMAVYESGYGIEKIANADGELINEKFSKWGVVSVPNGASNGTQKMEYLDNCSDYLIGIEEFIIATDNDDAGVRLKDELIRRLGVERCRTIIYPIEEVVPTKEGLKRRCKDLNEVLQYLGKETVIRVVENSEIIPVDGVFCVEDIFQSMLSNFRLGIQLAPTTRFKDFDEYFRWKKGDITLCTGYGNHGKTFFMLQLMLTKSIWDSWKWAIFCPENYPANDFYDDMVEMYVGKWLENMSEHEYTEALHFIDKHFFYVYPEDEHDIFSIHEKFRYLVMKKGVDGVMIDPFNQLDHHQKAFQREDMYLSELLKDIKRFALLNNVCYCIIAHPKNPNYNQDRSLPVVDMYDIAGGAVWGNKCDQILSYYRPRFHEDKNSPEVQIFVQKLKRKRTGGKLGHVDMCLIWSKKRYTETLSNETPCDAKLLLNGSPQKLFEPERHWTPYKDDISF